MITGNRDVKSVEKLNLQGEEFGRGWRKVWRLSGIGILGFPTLSPIVAETPTSILIAATQLIQKIGIFHRSGFIPANFAFCVPKPQPSMGTITAFFIPLLYLLQQTGPAESRHLA